MMKANAIWKVWMLAAVLAVVSHVVLAQNKTDENGLKQGVWVKKDDKGNVRYRGQFKDDHPYGKFKYYGDDGSIVTIMEFISPDTALATHYHPNQLKAAYGYYVNKQKEGVWRFYDRKGILLSVEEYKNGKKHGNYKVYNLDGSLSRETTFVNGVENGYRKTYNANGDLLTEGNYKDGVMDGVQKIYKDGQLNIIGAYQHAVRDGEWKYYDESGNLIKTEVYKLGILQ
jgi:antitoxin component YwqK of YwqJK toxin-antitoxin module